MFEYETLWLDLAIAFSCGGGGLVCGWIMHALGGFGNHTLVKQAAASISQSDSPAEPNFERVTEVADRLKDYASSMAANVDAHQTKVQAVNNSLIQGNDSSPEAVIAAVGQLIEANQTMQSQLQQAQDRIHQQAEQLESAERRAETDALTRVPNRGAFDAHLEKRHSLGSGEAGTLALLDIDYFKKFNDVYGHRAGDEVLKVVAKVLHTRLHSFGLVARYGGEEFAVILDGRSVQEAAVLVEQARLAIGEREIQFEDKCLRVSASAGVAQLMPGESIEDWLQRADDGLYKSKEEGRDCGHWLDATTPVRIALTEHVEPARDDKAVAATTPTATSAEPKTDKPANPADSPKPEQDASANAESDEASASPLKMDAPTIPDEPKVKLASAGETAEKKGDPSAFAYLPDCETLGASFEEIQGRTSASVSVFVMAIRCAGGASNASMRSLLQIVRATMRGVDRIGCGDETSLLICMPSVDEATALERGQQIHRSAEAIGLGTNDAGDNQVSVAVVEAGQSEEFPNVVSRVMQLAMEQPTDGEAPVFIESRHTAGA